MSDHIEKLKEKRREMDRKIKAAERAEAKRISEELLSAKHGLGIRLAAAHEVDTLDAITVLGDLLTEDGVYAYITKKRNEAADSPGGTSTAEGAESSDAFVHDEEPQGSVQQQFHDNQSWDSRVTDA